MNIKKKRKKSDSEKDASPAYLPLIESLNTLPLNDYISKLCPPSRSLSPVGSHSDNYRIDYQDGKSMSFAEFDACFDLIAASSATDYASSSKGWSASEKRKEMKLPDLRYGLIRKANDDASKVLGFYSFMLTYEDGYEVIYCYEIHLAEDLQGKGIGRQLMEMMEEIGKRAGVSKAMLTMFISNEGARRFYEKLGYKEDEYSPGPRKFRNGVVKRPDYVILSKPLKVKVKRAEHVIRAKKRKRG